MKGKIKEFIEEEIKYDIGDIIYEVCEGAINIVQIEEIRIGRIDVTDKVQFEARNMRILYIGKSSPLSYYKRYKKFKWVNYVQDNICKNEKEALQLLSKST